jgi:hypothetical protein
VAGSLGAVLLALAAVPAVVDLARRVRRRDLVPRDPITTILGLSVLGFTAAYSVAIVTHLPVFDRYALPTLPLVGLLLVRRRVTEVDDATATGRSVSARATSAAVVATVIALGVVGLAYATDSASYDAARWRVDEQVVRAGWSARHIDGGFEWIAWHRKVGPPAPAGTQAERIRRRIAYLAPFCIDVIVNPTPNARRHAIASSTVHGLWHAGETIVATPNGKPCPRVRRASSG